MIYEWDEVKYHSNVAKHRVRFESAREVWADALAIEIFDPDSSVEDPRFLRIGFSEFAGMLTVVFCERDNGHVIRIISARKSTNKEKRLYARRI
jgi:uncharacterized DUF497 family protein